MAPLETDQLTLHKLCWLVIQQWKAELTYSRAQYRVSYYRKLKTKLATAKLTSEKWNDHLELTKKIEVQRLNTLSKQKQLMDTKKRLSGSIIAARKKLNAVFISKDGKLIAVDVGRDKKLHTYDITQIAEIADQYEAQQALDKILK